MEEALEKIAAVHGAAYHIPFFELNWIWIELCATQHISRVPAMGLK